MICLRIVMMRIIEEVYDSIIEPVWFVFPLFPTYQKFKQLYRYNKDKEGKINDRTDFNNKFRLLYNHQ